MDHFTFGLIFCQVRRLHILTGLKGEIIVGIYMSSKTYYLLLLYQRRKEWCRPSRFTDI